ncbi:MAG: hypothetical protein B7Z73_04215 [Planctomycetia bacterium 21-64-5]|nr:MAG: hypothetical protein B7Z73_04215 [Planctomycetia bacterium 21-64-5]HQU43700.1 carboxypeptidase-like regulatory domain-containing protein [Pirellulales bacterium]
MLRLFASLLIIAAASSAPAAEWVRVQGAVREKDSERPVAGAVIQLSNGESEVPVESGEDGRYECRIPPGVITGQVVELPSPLVKPLRAFRAPVELAADPLEQSLPTIELRRGRTVRGRVVNADGKPVARASVQASWQAFEPWLESNVRGPKWLMTDSDEQGEFIVTGIDPVENPRLADRGVRFWAASGDMATETFVTPPPDVNAPVELRLSQNGMVSLKGRVVDTAGQAIAGARIQVWTQWRTDEGFVLVQTPLFLSAAGGVITDSAGYFQTPSVLSARDEYSLLVSCDGFLPARGTWSQPGQNVLADLPEIRLRRLRTVEGRVVDREGRPLPGVRVFQSGDGVQMTLTVSGRDGRFALAGVAENPAFLFAELDGYRFAGQAIAASADTQVVLSRDDESVAPLTLLRANVLDREEELTLAKQAIVPAVEQALQSGSRDERWDAIYYWSRLDPADALERLDSGAIADLTVDDMDHFRTLIARALARDHYDEAAAVASAIEGADRRARALFELASALPTSENATSRKLLDEALLTSTHADDPSGRALWQACAADGLLDLGETDRARRLLAEAGATAATLPMAGGGTSARRYIADVLARTDLPTALDLVSNLAEVVYRDRTLGKIAFRVAAQQPAEAERVLGMVGDDDRRGLSTPRVCYRMAVVDGERARRLAVRVSSLYLRALSLGWAARGWAISDPDRARQTLDEAFGILRSLVDAGEGRFYGPQSAAVAAAVLLPVVEAIDPRLVREYLWRAVSFRRSYPQGDQEDWLAEIATLSLLLAQYDREVARLALEPAVDHLRRQAVNYTGVCRFAAVYAACAIDPKWAFSLIDEDSSDHGESRFSLRQNFAWALAIEPSVRTRVLLENYPGDDYWLPGRPDNEFRTGL